MDVLRQVLDDPENQEHLKTALTTLLKEDPVSFYKFIAMPRLEKLSATPSGVDFSEMTPAEEAAAMVELAADFKRDMQRKHGVRTPTPDDSRCWGPVKEEHADVHEPIAETIAETVST